MNVIPDAQPMLDALCAGADPRKIRSPRLIHAICVEQRERGSDDYSIATIGRLSAERGGPAAGAIRNKPGEAYRALIRIFAGSTDSKATVPSTTRAAEIDRILEGASDPVLRTRLGLLLAELKSTRAQLLAARHLANRTATLDLANPSPEVLPSPSPLHVVTPLRRAHWRSQSPPRPGITGAGEPTRPAGSPRARAEPSSPPASSRRSARLLRASTRTRTTPRRASSSTAVASD